MPVRTAEASPEDKVTICHATSAHDNPYGPKPISVNKNSIINGGHDGHEGPVWYFGIQEQWGDIIPPFTYGHASSTQHYPGKNWSEGQTIWNNYCQVEFPPQETSVTLCKEDKDGKKLSGWELSLVSNDNTFSGITEEKCKNTGCITFEEVPYDTYEIRETLQKGWKNVSGLDKVQIKSENPTFTVVNEKIEAPKTGSITVCKIIIDPDGNIVDGSEKSGDVFVIPGLSSSDIPSTSPAPIGAIPNSQFTAPLEFNADLIGNDGINDAQCVTYDGLEFGGYYYGEEILPNKGWETPLYNDQHKVHVTSLENFFEFSGELLDGDPANDEERNTDADGHIVLSESRPNRTLVVLNQYKEIPQDKATIKAYKVVCEDESYLPNWVKTSGYPAQITEDLINKYVEDSEGKCWFESGWEFEWGYQGTAQKQDGDFYGPAGELKGWNSFDSATGDNTPAMLELEESELASIIWIREVLQQGYIPFAHPETGWDTGQEMVSAELLCHIDGYKYDNYDRVDNPQAGGTYFCVAFNAPEEATTTSVTLCKEDNKGKKLGGWELSLVSDDFSASGTTATKCKNKGCVTFENVPHGTYEIQEVLKKGWKNVSGLEEVEVDSKNSTFTVVNKKSKKPGDIFYLLSATTTGFGWVTSSPEGIYCGYEADDCEEEFKKGTDVTLTAEPGPGQKFDGWEGDCSGTSTVCVLTMNGIKSVSAAFSAIPGIITYTVTFMDGDQIYATTSVAEGESVGGDMPVDPEKEGYEFKGWEDGDNNPFTSETEVTGDITVYAIWQKKVEPDDPVKPEAPRRRPGQLLAPPRPEAVLGEEIVVEEPCTIYLYEYIRYGANNNPTEVIKLQSFLNQHMGTSLPLTGVYDMTTMQAVNEFQVQYKEQVLRPWVDAGAYCDVSQPTGHVYKTTQRWINLIVCPELNLPMPNLSGYPKADCAGYWRAVLGEGIVVDEDYVPEDVAEEPMPEEEEEEMPEEEMPFEIDDIVREEEPEEEPEIPTSWIIALIILAAAAGIWAVYKGIKK